MHTYAISPNLAKIKIKEIVEPPSYFRRLCQEWIDITIIEPPVSEPSMQIPSDVNVASIFESTVEPNMESPNHIDVNFAPEPNMQTPSDVKGGPCKRKRQ